MLIGFSFLRFNNICCVFISYFFFFCYLGNMVCAFRKHVLGEAYTGTARERGGERQEAARHAEEGRGGAGEWEKTGRQRSGLGGGSSASRGTLKIWLGAFDPHQIGDLKMHAQI